MTAMTSRASVKALAFICFLRCLTHTLARNCCYYDACNRNMICAKTGKTLTDSCPRRYTVKGDCSLRRNCCYRDECNKNIICADTGEIFTDSCPRSFTVLENCSVRGHCCYLDACNKKRICADVGETLKDSCPMSYTVLQGCVLRRQCCYIDACNGKRICADEGEILRDSCPRSYDVKEHCVLELSSSSTDHAPGSIITETEDGSSVENGDSDLEESLSEAEKDSSRVCRNDILEASLACGCGRFLNLFKEGERWKPLEELCLKVYGRATDSGSRQCNSFMARIVGGGSVSVRALQSYFATACERCVKNSRCSYDSSTDRMRLSHRIQKKWVTLCFLVAKQKGFSYALCLAVGGRRT